MNPEENKVVGGTSDYTGARVSHRKANWGGQDRAKTILLTEAHRKQQRLKPEREKYIW